MHGLVQIITDHARNCYNALQLSDTGGEQAMALDQTSLKVMLILLLAVLFWGFIIWQNTRKMRTQIKQVAHQQSVIRHNDDARALCRAVHLLQPGVHAGVDFIIEENGPDNRPYLAEWLANTPRPTPEQLAAALEELNRSSTAPGGFAAKRKAEYPGIEEQLEAAYLARQGDDSMQRELDARITKVREKYPKTDENL
jgi:hypothetical protein